MSIQDEILRSIELMIDKAINKVTVARTTSAIVEAIKNDRYKVRIDGGEYWIKDAVNCKPERGSSVWVHIPDKMNNAFIMGLK